jgi:hypothetical protein
MVWYCTTFFCSLIWIFLIKNIIQHIIMLLLLFHHDDVMIIIHVTKKNPEQPKISSRVTARRTSVISVKFCDQEFFYFC